MKRRGGTLTLGFALSLLLGAGLLLDVVALSGCTRVPKVSGGGTMVKLPGGQGVEVHAPQNPSTPTRMEAYWGPAPETPLGSGPEAPLAAALPQQEGGGLLLPVQAPYMPQRATWGYVRTETGATQSLSSIIESAVSADNIKLAVMFASAIVLGYVLWRNGWPVASGLCFLASVLTLVLQVWWLPIAAGGVALMMYVAYNAAKPINIP